MTNRLDTGQFDRNLVVIYKGDHVTIPKHDCKYCEHMVRCSVEWKEESRQWVLEFEGQVVAPLSIARGYSVEHTSRLGWSTEDYDEGYDS